MALDVESPDPPDLTNRSPPASVDADVLDDVNDLRRGELETALSEGAWTEAFEEWTEYTDLTEAEFEAIRKRGLFDRLDFYWDPIEEQLDFTVPEGWNPADDLSAMAVTELEALARTVVEMLEDGYLEWASADSVEDIWRSEPFTDDSAPEE